MNQSVLHLMNLLIHYRYGMVFVAALAEGPTVGIICGFLLRLGYFDFWPLYIFLIGVDLIGDGLWYCVGYFGMNRVIAKLGRFVSLDAKVMARIEAKFKKYQNATLLISKMTSGFGFAI